MFDTYKTIHDYSKIAKEMELDRKNKERISQNEIKSKNRVDISLEEYEKMKSDIARLEHNLYILENKLELFKEVIDLNIIPDTFRISHCDNYMGNPILRDCVIRFVYEIR